MVERKTIIKINMHLYFLLLKYVFENFSPNKAIDAVINSLSDVT